MNKNKIITVIIVGIMILITSFVLINTIFSNNTFKLKASVNDIELQDNEAMFIEGSNLNEKMKRLADSETEYFNSYEYESPIEHIEKSSTIADEYKSKNNFVSIDSGKPIYMWFNEENKTLYYYTEATKIYLNPSSYSMFFDLKKLKNIDLSAFDTSKVTDMYNMFAYCSSLKTINFGHNFDTSNVTDMNYMFSYDVSLTELDLSSFNTSKVTRINGMFSNCKKLTTIIYGDNWNTTNFTDLSYMFSGCESIVTLDLSKYNVGNVTNMNSMFSGCRSLTTIIYPQNWDTSNVENMNYLFANCESLETLDLSKYNTSKTVSMNGMFSDCLLLKTLNLSLFDTSKVTSMSAMFENCTSLTNLNLSNFNTSKVTNMAHMFENCTSLTSLDLSGFDTSNVTNMAYMFQDCISLTTLDVSSFNTENVTNTSYMFAGPQKADNPSEVNYDDLMKLTDIIGLDKWNTSNVKYMSAMFENNYKLTNIDVSKFNTSSVIDMSSLFYGCELLTTLNLSSFDTSKVTNMGTMFQFDKELTTIYVSDKFVIKEDALGYYMFNGCSKLKGQNGTTYSYDHMNIEYARIDKEGSSGYFTEYVAPTKFIVDEQEKRIIVLKTVILSELKEIYGNDIVLKDSKGNVKTDLSKLGTGDTLTIGNDTYNISVKGDITGDGEITFNDITTAYGCFKNKQGFTQEQILAIDIDDNSKIGFNDITSMYGMFKRSR